MSYSEQKFLRQVCIVSSIFNVIWLILCFVWADSVIGFLGYWMLGALIVGVGGGIAGVIFATNNGSIKPKKTYKTTNTLLLAARM